MAESKLDVQSQLAGLAPEARARVEAALKATLEKELAAVGAVGHGKTHDKTHDRTPFLTAAEEQ